MRKLLIFILLLPLIGYSQTPVIKKGSALDAATSVSTSDELILLQSGTTKRMPINLLPFVGRSSFSVTPPLSYDNITGVFSMPAASPTQNGYIPSAAYMVFNNKEPGLGNPSTNGYVLSSTTAGVRSWIPMSGGGATNLDALTDVVISSPSTGQVLRFNGTNWVNVALVAGDIPVLDWSKITTGKPTNLSGYGITDAYPLSGNPSGFLTTTTGDARYPQLSASYSNPSWISSLASSKLTWTGTTLQYVRGDGSLATFPTNVSTFTNDANYHTGALTSGGVAVATGTSTLTTSNALSHSGGVLTTLSNSAFAPGGYFATAGVASAYFLHYGSSVSGNNNGFTLASNTVIQSPTNLLITANPGVYFGGGSTSQWAYIDAFNFNVKKPTEITVGINTYVPLTVKGGPGQIANLQEWKNNSSALLGFVSADATLIMPQIAAIATSDVVPLGTKGSASQTADLFQAADNSGSVLMWIDKDGIGNFPSVNITGVASLTSLKVNQTTVTSTYNITGSEYQIFANATGGSLTITLPAASSNIGRVVSIKKIDATGNTVTIDPNGSETVDGSLTLVLSAQYTNKILISNGTNWFVQ